jgi:hypothetical protein
VGRARLILEHDPGRATLLSLPSHLIPLGDIPRADIRRIRGHGCHSSGPRYGPVRTPEHGPAVRSIAPGDIRQGQAAQRPSLTGRRRGLLRRRSAATHLLVGGRSAVPIR